MTTCLVIRI